MVRTTALVFSGISISRHVPATVQGSGSFIPCFSNLHYVVFRPVWFGSPFFFFFFLTPISLQRGSAEDRDPSRWGNREIIYLTLHCHR